jgi:hypothetical protein
MTDPTRPKFDYCVVSSEPYRDSTIETVEARPLQPRVKARTLFRAIPARKGKPQSHLLASESDARRWIDECETGGDLAAFQHSLSRR